MKMLLKQLIESPITSSKLLVCDPFRELDQEELVMEVIGLANADVEGPRNILFGVNAGSVEGGRIVGITDGAMADLKLAHRTISELIDPALHLALIYDRINGKLVGALEIDGCDDKPYIVAKNHSERLRRGQCWTRNGRDLRAAQPGDLAVIKTSAPKSKPASEDRAVMAGKPPPISVGFNGEPDCELLELAIPDSSDPPFSVDEVQAKESMDLTKTIKEKIGTVTTRLLGLGGKSKQENETDGGKHVADTQVDEFDEAESVLADANNHYFFEEKALRLNLSVCNKGAEAIENVSIKLGFPRPTDFDVVDRLYASPFDKRSQHQARTLGYPDVDRRDDAIFVRGQIGTLAPDSPTQAFDCELRLAVGPRMHRKKLAIVYTLRGENKQTLGAGRLKIKFRNSAA